MCYFGVQSTLSKKDTAHSVTILEEFPSDKLPTYPSPKPTICPKRDVSLIVSLGEGYGRSFPEPKLIRPS